MSKRALKFAKRARCEIRYLELFNRMMKGRTVDGRNGGISKDADWMNILEREMPFCLKQMSQEMELQ